jgi:hypothetical protein
MPRSIYEPPFHRRIAPWVFVTVFLISAPILIFYTSGYRFNPNKVTIERNGTLIVDSVPRGATVFLNDQDIRDATAATLQNLAPGPYKIRVTRNAYLPWEKTLDVRAEQVTFANSIHLWFSAPATLMRQGFYSRITASADGDTIAALDASSTEMLFLTTDNRLISRVRAPESDLIAQAPIRWSLNGTSLLMGGTNVGEEAWWTAPDALSRESGVLPPGQFFWNANELTGYDGERQYTLNPRLRTLTSERLPASQLGALDGLTLEVNTSTGFLILRSRSILHQLFQLPRGDWQFADQQGAYTLLKDGNRWLAVRIRVDGNRAEEVTGDWPRWLPSSEIPTALFLNQNEIWTWELGSAPVLIARQSEPFVQVAWHPDGQTIFVASKNELYALELDDRGGRQKTSLASFDMIYDMTYADGSIFLNAEMGGVRGMYRRIVD